jgi:hypothetical protein
MVSIPVAGVWATFGVASGAAAGVAVGAGIIGGGVIVKDILSEKRTCTEVSFHERHHQNAELRSQMGWKDWSKSWFKSHEDWSPETTYSLNELNVLEIMGQMKDQFDNPFLGKEYARNEIPAPDRLNSIMACNFLPFAQEKWADLGGQSSHMVEMMKKHKGIENAVIAECGRWLCAGEALDVTQLTPGGKCGGRRVR